MPEIEGSPYPHCVDPQCYGGACPQNGVSLHVHCVSCGDPLIDDGEDRSPLGVRCAGCDELIHKTCAKSVDDKSRCFDCHESVVERVRKSWLVAENLAHAIEDLRASRKLLESESRPLVTSEVASLFNDFQVEFGLYGRALSETIMRVHSLPLPGMVAAA